MRFESASYRTTKEDFDNASPHEKALALLSKIDKDTLSIPVYWSRQTFFTSSKLDLKTFNAYYTSPLVARHFKSGNPLGKLFHLHRTEVLPTEKKTYLVALIELLLSTYDVLG